MQTADLLLLIKKQINVAFTIDVSGSMSEELPTIKTKVAAWVNSLLANPVAPKLSLVTFENFIVFEGTTCSPTTFLGWVNGLSASGGSGCGESSITAALRAADLVGKGGIVVLATDEPPNEGPDLKEKLKKKPVKVYTIWDRFDCSSPRAVTGEGAVASGPTPLDSGVYAEIAAATGGLSFASLADVDLGLAEVFEATTPRLYDLALVEGTVSPPAENIVTVPVNSTVERLDLVLTSMEGASHAIEVRRPDGTVVAPTDADATFVSSTTFHSVRISAPAIGEWTIGISGEGPYQASAMGVTDIALFDVSFLRFEDTGDSIPRIASVPASLNPGEIFDVELDLLGQVDTVSFELVSPDGSLIEPLTTTEDVGGVGIFAAQYTPIAPIDRFYIRAVGTDTTGAPFQRMLRRAFSVSSIAVRPPESQVSSPGCQLTYTFEIENTGIADTFDITRSSSSGFSVSLTDYSLTMASGEIGFVDALVLQRRLVMAYPFGTRAGLRS